MHRACTILGKRNNERKNNYQKVVPQITTGTCKGLGDVRVKVVLGMLIEYHDF
jgi:hypothetical protein